MIEAQQVRHGGDIENAIQNYGGEPQEWLDLSTGISPWNYPIPQFEPSTWRNLPSPDGELLAAASAYYQCQSSEIAVTPGSQLAIRLIPQLLKGKQTVAVPLIGYQEHANSWELAGHKVFRYQTVAELDKMMADGLVNNSIVINPNNPTAEQISTDRLAQVSSRLSGLLIVDQAFSDLYRNDKDHDSLGLLNRNSNVVILKSIGKFFGLAGARIGFAIGKHPIVNQLQMLFSPWSIAGPSLQLATMALRDTEWQRTQIKRINQHAERQRLALSVIKQSMPSSQINDQGLFFSIFDNNDRIVRLHQHLAKDNIWARLGDPFQDQFNEQLNWLRLSLAGDQLDRLSATLQSLSTNPHNTTTLL
ncbi:MAG: cobalamin biosynthetic protein CobC [Arenicella sp.]